MSLTLYSYPGDFRALKALVAASYNNVKIETPDFKVGEDNTKPEFLAKSPMGKVPLLETAQGCVFESNAIARYVARLRADTELLGVTFFEQAQVDAWIEFCVHQLEAPVSAWLHPVLGYTNFDAKVYAQAVKDTHAALAVLNTHLTSNTYLVGHKVTLADIVCAMTLYYAFKLVLDPAQVNKFPAVGRWFLTVVNQAPVKAVIGEVALAQEEMKAENNKTSAAAVAGKTNAKKEKKSEKKEEKKVEKKEAAAPAPAPAAAAEAPKKAKNPLDELPPSSMAIDDFKRHYSNAPNDANGDRDFYATMPEFWEKMYDPSGYSIWFCRYNYNEENKQGFMTSNLVGGFVQRCDAVRKYAFGAMHVIGETAPFEVEGCWMIRGDSMQPMLDNNPDAEYYTWTKVDTNDPAVRQRVNDFWCTYDKVDGNRVVYDSKTFK